MPGGGKKPLDSVTLRGKPEWYELFSGVRRTVAAVGNDYRLKAYVALNGCIAIMHPTASTEAFRAVLPLFQMVAQVASDTYQVAADVIEAEKEVNLAELRRPLLNGMFSFVTSLAVEYLKQSAGAPPIPMVRAQARVAESISTISANGVATDLLAGKYRANWRLITATATAGLFGIAQAGAVWVFYALHDHGVFKRVWDLLGELRPFGMHLRDFIWKTFLSLALEGAILYIAGQYFAYSALDQTAQATGPYDMISQAGNGLLQKFGDTAASLFRASPAKKETTIFLESCLTGAVAYLSGMYAQLEPAVVQVYANFQSPGLSPYPVLTRQDDGSRALTATDIYEFLRKYGNTNVEEFGGIFEHPTDIYDRAAEYSVDISSMHSVSKGMLGSSEIWDSVVTDVASIESYRFCSISNYEKWTGRSWPSWGGYGNTPTGAASGIAIDYMCLVNKLRPVRLCLAYVKDGIEAGLSTASQTFVENIFGTTTQQSSIRRWRWNQRGTDEPRTLAELPTFIQHGIATEVLNVGVVNSILFHEPRPYDGNILRFVKLMLVAVARAALQYSFYPAACLRVETRTVSYPPSVAENEEMQVNGLLWMAWCRLCSPGQIVGAWTNRDGLRGLLEGDSRTHHIAEMGSENFIQLQSNLQAISGPQDKKKIMQRMLNLDPVNDIPQHEARTVMICRYFLYLLIPTEERGLGDVSIGGIYSKVVFENMPGYCPICRKQKHTFRWIIDGNVGINGFTLPDPGSIVGNNQRYNRYCLQLISGEKTKEGCLECYMKEGIKLIQRSEGDAARELSIGLAKKINAGELATDEMQRDARRQVEEILRRAP